MVLSEQFDLIKKAETLIQRIQNLDYVVESGGDTSSLDASMTLFDMSINESESNRIPYAMLFLMYFNQSLTKGIIKPGQGLVNELKDCSEENINPRKELETTSDSLMRAKERIEELEAMMPTAGSEHA